MADGDLTIDIKGEDRDLQKALDNSEKGLLSFGKIAKGVFVAVGAAIVVNKLKDWGAAFLNLYKEQADAEQRLESVVKATGNAAGFTAGEMKQLASAMQAQTKIGDEVILNSQAILATFKNIKGDNFKATMMAAADMAEVLGTDLKGATMQLGKALNDPLLGMSKLAEAGVSFSDQQKQMVKDLQDSGDVMGAQKVLLDELAGQFGGSAKNAASTFSGQMQQMWNTIGDVGEVIGAALIPAMQALQPVVEAGLNLILNLTSGLGEAGEAGAGFAERTIGFMGKVASFISDQVIGAVSTFQVLWENGMDAGTLAVNGLAYGAVVAFNEVVHFLTKVIPGYLTWFADNWKEIFTDIGNLAITIFKNMWKNVTDFWDSLKGLLSGEGANFKFTGLTDGFESAIKELPEIAEREIGPVEKQLGDRVSKLSKSLGDKIAEKNKENKEAFAALFKGSGSGPGFDDIVGTATTDASKAFAVSTSAEKKAADKAAAAAKSGAGEGTTEGVGSSSVGLAELNKKISGSAGAAEKKAADARSSMMNNLKDLKAETTKANARGESVDQADKRHKEELKRFNQQQTASQEKATQSIREATAEAKAQTMHLKTIATKLDKASGLA